MTKNADHQAKKQRSMGLKVLGLNQVSCQCPVSCKICQCLLLLS